MGALAATLFTRVQAADFYRTLLRDALALLPDGNGRTLLDAGCGPGMLTRLAAELGYRATGFDGDPRMIARANRIGHRQNSPATFVVADLGRAPGRFPPADVVVAASLLAVVPDVAGARDALWACTAPGGTLLVLEASQHMSTANADRLLASRASQPGDRFLALWAHARQGRTVDPAMFATLPRTGRRQDHPLLAGLVRATLIDKAAAEPAVLGNTNDEPQR